MHAITAQEIADRTGGRVEGDGSRVVHGVETVDKATPDMLTWVGSPEYASKAAASKAGVILLPLEGDAPAEKTIIRVADPDLALCEVLKMPATPQDVVEPGVHPSALIGEGAVVEGTAIGPNVFLGKGAHIGPGTTLYPGVFVGRGRGSAAIASCGPTLSFVNTLRLAIV